MTSKVKIYKNLQVDINLVRANIAIIQNFKMRNYLN